MKYLFRLFGIVVLAQISACTSLPTATGTIDEQIDYWLSQHEYGKALTLTTDLNESSTSVINTPEKTQEKIHNQIAHYEQQVVTNAEAAAANSDWRGALALYQDALSRLPDSKPLQQGLQQIMQRQTDYLKKLELDRLIAKGEWTYKDLEISKLTDSTNAEDWFGNHTLNSKITVANDLALELAEHGKHALKYKDLALAKRVLPLAMNLSATIEIKALNAKLQEMLTEEALFISNEQKRIADEQLAQQKLHFQERDKKKRSATTSNEQKKNKRLMADFKKAFNAKKLAEAQQLRRKLEEQGFDNPEFKKLGKQLDNDIAKQVKHLLETGVTYYSQQQYDQALSVWKKAQLLDSQNTQLNAHIERVTRVLEKLQRLRNKNGPKQ